MSSGKNTTYRIQLSAKASKYLLRLNQTTASRLLDRMEALKTDPYRIRGVKRLTGRLAGLYRLRIGDYRFVYEIREADKIIVVLVIGAKGDIYKRGES